MKPMAAWLGRLEAALDDAFNRLAAGEPKEAAQRADAVHAAVRALKAALELEKETAPPEEENDDEVRARIGARIARFVEYDQQGDVPPEFREVRARILEEGLVGMGGAGPAPAE